MMSDPVTTLAIHNLLTFFFQSFDDKNWRMLRECLCEKVYADYSSFRGAPAQIVSAAEYIEQRRTATRTLEMQHNFLNLRVEQDPEAKTASARCNFIVHRFQMDSELDDRYFHSYGHYVFGFMEVNGRWRISRITQHMLRSQGDRDIHGALRGNEAANWSRIAALLNRATAGTSRTHSMDDTDTIDLQR
jgi:hypothetical protein